MFFLSVPVAFAGLSAWVGLDTNIVKRKLEELYTILIVLGFSVSGFLFFYAEDIIKLLFQRGAFNQHSVEVTSDYLRGMCIGLWAQVIGYIFLKALSAQLKNKKVLFSMAIALFGNAIFNLLTYSTYGALGIGLGCSVYGILLLLSSAYFMGIHKILFYPFIKLLLGMMVYYILIYSFFSNSGLTGLVIVDLAFNGLVYLLFFFVWCMIFRDIRNKFVNVFISKKRGGDE